MAWVDGPPQGPGGQDAQEEDVGEEGEVGEHQDGMETHLVQINLEYILGNGRGGRSFSTILLPDSWFLWPQRSEETTSSIAPQEPIELKNGVDWANKRTNTKSTVKKMAVAVTRERRRKKAS